MKHNMEVPLTPYHSVQSTYSAPHQTQKGDKYIQIYIVKERSLVSLKTQF